MGVTYRDLLVWQRAMDLAEAVYSATQKFPKEEMYGLTSQMRRCSVSVPANIAEGHGRNQPKSFAYFLRVAIGSLKELETHILLAQRFRMIDDTSVNNLLNETEEIAKMLHSLIRRQKPSG